MSIRLNKAISELNIGLQTAVDFLLKHTKLGEVKPELSFKLNDEQYEALVSAFKGDKEVHTQAEKIFKKPEKKEKVKAPAVAEKAETPSDALRKERSVQPLGTIDLSALDKKKKAKKEEEPVAVEEPKVEEKQEVTEPETKEETAPVAEEVAPEVSEPAEPVQTPWLRGCRSPDRWHRSLKAVYRC